MKSRILTLAISIAFILAIMPTTVANGTDFIAQYAHIIDKELGIWNPYFGIYDYRTNSYAIHCCPKGLYLNCQKGMCSMIEDLCQCYPPNTYPLE